MADVDVICHQVNCQGKMASGIAKTIREKYPEVYQEYMRLCDSVDHEALLGQIQSVALHAEDKDLIVINMFAQYNYGYDGRRYTSYDAFYNCLHHIRTCVDKELTIGFPKNIGCCRGGANWNVIRTMIEDILFDREVYIYELEV